ncbi:MAG TPA: FoF1 ATP synthase subunit a, partial [Thermomicrobiales bacterium]|nr:FoF1 ATP synthase subunit a [Thermomicrobiales bacterium]
AMALVTFTLVQVVAIRSQGVGGRIKHMAQPPWLFPIELVSELSRILSLTARLFGNVFAGEVLLGVMYSAGSALKIAVIPFLFPVLFLGLEVLFGSIQAIVFSLLTAIYLVLAAPPHDDDADGHQDEDAHAVRPVAASAAGD